MSPTVDDGDFLDLVECFIAGSLDAIGHDRLRGVLRADARLERRFAHLIHAEALLRRLLMAPSASARVALADEGRRHGEGPTPSRDRPAPERSPRRARPYRPRTGAGVALAAALALVVGVAMWWTRLAITADGMPMVIASAQGGQVIDAAGRTRAPSAGTHLRPGDRLVLSPADRIDLGRRDRIAVELDGPAEWRLSDATTAALESGSLRMTARPGTAAGAGLALLTPCALVRLVDEDFTVTADAGATRVTVERGRLTIAAVVDHGVHVTRPGARGSARRATSWPVGRRPSPRPDPIPVSSAPALPHPWGFAATPVDGPPPPRAPPSPTTCGRCAAAAHATPASTAGCAAMARSARASIASTCRPDPVR